MSSEKSVLPWEWHLCGLHAVTWGSFICIASFGFMFMKLFALRAAWIISVVSIAPGCLGSTTVLYVL